MSKNKSKIDLYDNLKIRFRFVIFNIYPEGIMKKATLSLLAKHLNPASQVVMRADFNVPIKDGKITDANRIKSNISH